MTGAIRAEALAGQGADALVRRDRLAVPLDAAAAVAARIVRLGGAEIADPEGGPDVAAVAAPAVVDVDLADGGEVAGVAQGDVPDEPVAAPAHEHPGGVRVEGRRRVAGGHHPEGIEGVTGDAPVPDPRAPGGLLVAAAQGVGGAVDLTIQPTIRRVTGSPVRAAAAEGVVH